MIYLIFTREWQILSLLKFLYARFQVLLVVCFISFGGAQSSAEILAYQDSLGQYSFGYSAPGSARSEVRTLNGETHGAYSYIDDAGVIQTAHYTADGENGFRVAATNLPVAPLPMQEVQNITVTKPANLQEEEVMQDMNNIGENNVFLKGLKPVQNATMELEKNLQSEMTIEESMKSENLTETMKTGEGRTLGEMLKITSEAQSQAESSQNATTENSKASSNEMPLNNLNVPMLPIFRVSHGNLAIDPSTIQGPINTQGSPNTPASTTLKIAQEMNKMEEKTNVKELPAPQEQQILTDLPKEILTPLNILPLRSAYPTLIRYTHIPTLHYLIYNHA
ncbi:Cuticle protein 6 [Anthophora plagiata]